MLRAGKSFKPLSGLEHLVLDTVWRRGSVTADEVRTALARIHPMKDSTVRTILKRLEDKGYVRHRVQDRTNVYSGRQTPRIVAARAVRQIVDRFCHGSVEELLLGMVDHAVVEEGELQLLAQRLAERRKRGEGA